MAPACGRGFCLIVFFAKTEYKGEIMNWQSILVGLGSFLIIGLFHPIVVKGEYYFSKKIWPVFLLAGIGCLVWALLMEHMAWACLISMLGFTCLWSILELFEQEERVKKGWAPANPKRK